MPPLPPFLTTGEDGARFYALAYCRGAYGSKEPWTQPVFLVLYFSTDPEFSRFSKHIVDADGYCFAYSRGSDKYGSPEYALLSAWESQHVSPAKWRLFPLAGIPDDAWPEGSEDRAAYSAVRADFCRIVYPFRIEAQFEVPPLFHPDPDFVPPSIMTGESSEESEEIFRAISEAEPGWDPAGDDSEG